MLVCVVSKFPTIGLLLWDVTWRNSDCCFWWVFQQRLGAQESHDGRGYEMELKKNGGQIIWDNSHGKDFWKFVLTAASLEKMRRSHNMLSTPMQRFRWMRSEDEERWVGSKFAACVWIFIEEVSTEGHKSELWICGTNVVHGICANWACVVVFCSLQGELSESFAFEKCESVTKIVDRIIMCGISRHRGTPEQEYCTMH